MPETNQNSEEIRLNIGQWLASKNKEDKSNKVSKWSTTPTNNNFPSEKLVKDSLNDKADSSSLATVATTGDYDDLSNTPAIPTVVDTVQDNNNNI